jgi:hypothetical protein
MVNPSFFKTQMTEIHNPPHGPELLFLSYIFLGKTFDISGQFSAAA